MDRDRPGGTRRGTGAKLARGASCAAPGFFACGAKYFARRVYLLPLPDHAESTRANLPKRARLLETVGALHGQFGTPAGPVSVRGPALRVC